MSTRIPKQPRKPRGCPVELRPFSSCRLPRAVGPSSATSGSALQQSQTNEVKSAPQTARETRSQQVPSFKIIIFKKYVTYFRGKIPSYSTVHDIMVVYSDCTIDPFQSPDSNVGYACMSCMFARTSLSVRSTSRILKTDVSLRVPPSSLRRFRPFIH